MGGSRSDRPKPVTDRRRLALIVIPMAAFAIAANVGNAFAPTLITNEPVLLLVLSPRFRWLLLVAPQVSPLEFFAIPLVRQVGVIAVWYAFGHRYGDRAVIWLERRAGRHAHSLRRIEVQFHRFRLPLAVAFPGAIVSLLAGAGGMSFALLVALATVGLAVRLAAVRWLASAFRGPLLDILDWISDNQIWLTAASVACVALWIWFGRRRGVAEIPTVEEIAEELDEAAEDPTPRV